MSTQGPHPSTVVLGTPRTYRPDILTSGGPAAALARHTRVGGILALQVRMAGPDALDCSSGSCTKRRTIDVGARYVHVTYADRPPWIPTGFYAERFHFSCYRWEFIK